MKTQHKTPIPEEVLNCATILINTLLNKVNSIGYRLSECEKEEAHQYFLVYCHTLSVHFLPNGSASLKSYLHSRTLHSVDEYLRNRNRKKRALIRKAQSLHNEDGTERFHDRKNELEEYFQQDEQEHFIAGLEPHEQKLMLALIEYEGNLTQAAASIRMEESRARRCRKAIQTKFHFFEKK